MHVVVGARDRLVARRLAADDLDQLHPVHRREEVQADEALRARALAAARPVIGSVEVLLAKTPPGASIGSASRRHRRLQGAVLEHRLDDQVAAVERAHVARRRDEREQAGLAQRRRAGPWRPAPTVTLRIAARPGLGLLARHVLQHAGDAARRVGVGDAGAHHAGAEDADLRRPPRPARPSAAHGPSGSRSRRRRTPGSCSSRSAPTMTLASFRLSIRVAVS